MIKHVVLFKFKPDVNEEKFRDVEKGLAELPGKIPEIKAYEFGLDVVRSERSYDFVLVSEFEDLDALKTYQTHPAHLAVLEILKPFCAEIIAGRYWPSSGGNRSRFYVCSGVCRSYWDWHPC